LALYAGVGLLLALWGLRMLLEGRLSWKKCPVALCLAGLFLLGIWQLTPLPARLLGWLSPATVRTCDQFLPSQPEALPQGQTRDAAALPAGSTLSLYPGATRRESLRLLAVFLLFAAVRNNTASAAALRRLSIAALANGALLSLFALIQFFTSPRNTLYWTYPSQGTVFGPFICRNHFPFYINLCLGLGVGLLLSLRPSGHAPARTGHVPGEAPKDNPWLSSPLSLLNHPQALWISVALALMLSAVVFSLSRGGLLALLGGGLVCLLINLSCSPRFLRAGTALLIVAMALGLVTWFGFDRVEARLATLWQGEALQEDRIAVWSYTLPLVKDFPLWGTGWGTFPYVEPLYAARCGESGSLLRPRS
jgi:hypothetical protein